MRPRGIAKLVWWSLPRNSRSAFQKLLGRLHLTGWEKWAWGLGVPTGWKQHPNQDIWIAPESEYAEWMRHHGDYR